MEVVTEKPTKKAVPEGYKWTEVGVIPEDWDVIKFSEAFSFLRTGTNSRSDLSDNGEVHYIHYGDIHAKWDNILDFENSKIPYIASEKIIGLPFLEEGDLIVADASEDYEGVGASVEVKNLNGKKAVAGLHTILLRSDGILVDNFKAYITRIDGVREALLKVCTGTTVYGISKSKLKEVKLPLPTLEEQRAIAEALSDVDALIAELDALIEKKQQVKKGAMQQLLTGKKRLPGFDGEWETVQLSEKVSKFIVPMRDKPKKFTGNIPWCRIEDFNGKYLRKSKENRCVDKETVSKMNLKVYPKDTLLVSCSADLGRCAIIKKPLVTNQTFIGLVCDMSKVSEEFLYYYMTFNAGKLNNLSSGTTISYLSRDQFKEFVINVPQEIEEQKAIARILSDMDAEIQALLSKRAKYKNIKQGMMQELLTGKTRLV